MYFIYLYFILFVELLYKFTSIWRKLMSLITKKVTAQNLPYFHQNSLKIFLNLTDCWKKYGNYVIMTCFFVTKQILLDQA